VISITDRVVLIRVIHTLFVVSRCAVWLRERLLSSEPLHRIDPRRPDCRHGRGREDNKQEQDS